MKPVRKQIILVTGVTDGIGRIAARLLSQMNATVLLHGRDGKKCRDVKEEILKAGGKHQTAAFTADLASLSIARCPPGLMTRPTTGGRGKNSGSSVWR